jgi:type VI secretion system protein ImpJ
MKLLSRVVWSEGMYLAPHHFQTQCRYFEDAIEFATSSLWFKPYGLSGCEMDPEALQNGTISIRHARGWMADGLPFNMPGSDPVPEPRSIAQHFSPTRDSQTVLLAIPQRRNEGRNFAGPPGNGLAEARFLAETHVIPDETNGRDEKPVEIGRKNFRLQLDSEPADGLTTIALARVRRDGAGRFVYDPTFIPPLLTIAASEYLMGLLRRLCELLDEKGKSLTEGRVTQSEDLADYFRRDLVSFWFLHTIYSCLGGLRHQLLSKKGHPEELYAELLRLAGGLCCFALDAHPRDLPLYDHDNLTGCFDTLDQKIRAWLNLMVPANCFSIPLRPSQPYYWTGAASDARFFDRSRWILEVQSKAGEAYTIARTPQLVKVCSERFVAELVRRAVPGLPLSHVSSPPPEVPTKVEAQYFSVTKQGPCWEDISHTRRIGVYVPGDLPEPQLTIHIILER